MAGSLPANLIYQPAKITFTITSATNSSVTVYKSTDAAHWLPLQTITGISTQQPKSYQVYNNHPANGINYYKLQETTVAGSHTESGVKALVFDNHQTAFITLYRNPAKASHSAYRTIQAAVPQPHSPICRAK